MPRYDEERDTFVLSGTEDLVPLSGSYPGTVRYRPRTEGLFARIERSLDAANDHWEVRSKDGAVSVYGTPGRRGADPAVIAQPESSTTASSDIFAWRLTQTSDPFGNRIQYTYRNDVGHAARPWQQNLLKQISYAEYERDGQERFLASVTFYYDDEPLPEIPDSRTERPDPFSDYRAGFEVRTSRRCTWIAVRTDTDAERSMRAYRLVYLDERADAAGPMPFNGVSLLSEIAIIGFDDDGVPHEELPPLEFDYTRFTPGHQRFSPVTGADMPPGSLARAAYELVDLTGEGLPDVVEIDGAVRYWRNLGGGRFDLPRTMRSAPAGLSLADPGVQLIDVDGDGRADLLVGGATNAGSYPLTFTGEWDRRGFRPFTVAPSFNLEDPQVHLVDLDGDGVTDAVRSGTRLECYFGDPRAGWDESRWAERQTLDRFPDVSFADPRVRWADMTGDGLADIVLVYDRNVEYWPNLGRGAWAARVHMRSGPALPAGYDPRRLLLGDVDGDGLADLVYVEDTRVTLWINQAGNGWSPPVVIDGTPPVTDMDAVRLVDLLGNGIAGLLWTRDAGQSRHSMYFLDFTGGTKPYLLNAMDNHLGARTLVQYAPSTRYYLADQAQAATRWRTTLPFPVQVVARVEVIDAVSGGKLTSRFSYHHGCWDGVEHEFRGFGLVERFDTESFSDYDGAGLHGSAPFAKVPSGQFAPPTLTRTWFHLGPVVDVDDEWAAVDFTAEYWTGDPPVFDQHTELGPVLADQATRRARRDALRALRGSILRTEVYALDGPNPVTQLYGREDQPYTVTESLYGMRDETPGDAPVGQPRVFFPHLLARRTTRWERGDDPLTVVSFAASYDAFGQPGSRTEVACPRGWRSLAQRSDGYLAVRTATVYAAPGQTGPYIHDRPALVTSYRYGPSQAATHTLREVANLPDDSAHLIITDQTLHFYDGEAQSPPTNRAFEGLRLHQIGRYGALVRTLNLVLTDEIVAAAYGTSAPPYLLSANPAWPGEYPAQFQTLAARAGYVQLPRPDRPTSPGLYALGEQRRYDFHDDQQLDGRGLPVAVRDPLGHETTISYDDYGLLATAMIDPLGLTTTATHNYRVLQPTTVTDPNGNLTEYRFSPYGLLSEVWVRGDPAQSQGDRQLPSVRIEYDFLAYERGMAQVPPRPAPLAVRTIRQVHHDTELDVPPPDRAATIETREYSDGFGRLVQTRVQAEERIWASAGAAPPDLVFADDMLPGVQPQAGADLAGYPATDPQQPWVVVSGWQVYDNRGRVVEKFEPYFAAGWDYQAPAAAHLAGSISVTLTYDPIGRTVRTTSADGSQRSIVYGIPTRLDTPQDYRPTPWEMYTYDANDNAGRTHPATAAGYGSHWNTPGSAVFDALGRTVSTVARNGPDPATDWYTTVNRYDLNGNLAEITDPLGRTAFSFVHDLSNRPLHVTSIDAGKRWTVYDANGNVIERRDGRDALVLAAHDALNRPVRVWACDEGGTPTTLRQELSYGDGGDRQQSAAQRDANRALNRLGRPTRHRDEAGELTIVEYDFKGNLLDRERATIADGPILAALAAAAPGQPPRYGVDWTQPPALDPPHRTSLSHDALNRLKRMSLPEDVDTPITGERKELTPHYNRAGALERIELDGAVYVAQIAYNARGQRTLVAYGNGLLTRYAYERRTFRLARLRTEGYGVPGPWGYHPTGGVLQDFGYSHDLVGNIRRIADRTPGCGIPVTPDTLDRDFSYDPIYRLVSASGRECDSEPPDPWDPQPRCGDITRTRAYLATYAYDEAGNLRRMSSTTTAAHTFDLVAGTNRLLTATYGQTLFDYRYDANGNLTGEALSRQFGWDHADRLVGFSEDAGGVPSTSACYLYDASGQRVKKLVRNQQGHLEVTVYIDGVFEQLRLDQGGTSLVQNLIHVMDGQGRIATVRVGSAFPGDGAADKPVQYHLGDHLDSSNIVVGGADAQAQTFVRREEHYPYGATSFGSYGRKRYRFTGKERDEESGLSYHGARYYASWLGRWISPDPAGVIDGPNLYRYARSSPLVLTDPTGTDSDVNGTPRCAPDMPKPPATNLVKSPEGGGFVEAPKAKSSDQSSTEGGGIPGGFQKQFINMLAATGKGPAGSIKTTGNADAALTFDDGPDPTYTPQILDLLKANEVKATFCLVGRQVKANPGLVRRIVAEGHTLCNHTWVHSLTLGTQSKEVILKDLQDTNNAIREAAPDAKIQYFRAPGGNFTPLLVGVASELGMKSIYWAVDTRDWEYNKWGHGPSMVNHIIDTVESNIRQGSIVLSHDYRKPDTITAYKTLLPWLKANVTLAPLPVN